MADTIEVTLNQGFDNPINVTIYQLDGLGSALVIKDQGATELSDTRTINFSTGLSVTVSGSEATVTNTITQYTDALATLAARAAISAGTGISYNSSSGVITNSGVTSITGTTDQVNASASTGGITLSLPQSIATTSTPRFAGLGIGVAAPSSGVSVSAANAALLSSSSSSSSNYGLRVMIAGGAVAGLNIGASGMNGYLTSSPSFAHHFVGQVYCSAEIIVGASGSVVTSGSQMNIVASGGYSISFGSNGSANELFLLAGGKFGTGGQTTPTSFTHMNKSVAFQTTQKTSANSPYTATESDNILLIDSTAGPVTVNLPTASGITGRVYTIKDWKGQSAANNITIDASGSETIDGSATIVLSTNYAFRQIVSDGTNWAVISS